MQHHGPNGIAGPVRGTRGWWQRLGQRDAPPEHAPPHAPPEPKLRGKRRKRSSESGIRADLVARVRAEIAAGTYDTPEKWDAALDALLERLERE
jgi:hypothetical protein